LATRRSTWVRNPARRIAAFQSRQLGEAGRAGDVHLDEEIPDDVDADEHQALPAEERREVGADLQIARGELHLHRARAHRHVGRFSVSSGTRRNPAERFAIQQEDPLVSLPRRGDVRLHHRPLPPARGEELEDRGRVAVVPREQHDALAAVSVHGLTMAPSGELSMKARSCPTSRLTRVAGVSSGKCSAQSFSFAVRSPEGEFT
jgi:hypothetical protein